MEKAEVTEKKSRVTPSRTVEGRPLEVTVDDRGLERAIRQLKRRVASEGVTREIKRRRHYEKPSVRKRRKAREAERRRRRAARRLARRLTGSR
jgi:small subunit ribosomal protein S21